MGVRGIRDVRLVCAALLACAAVAPVATASAADAPTDDDGDLVLVLDASGSMAEPVPGGGTRIEAAREALGRVVASLPDAQPVGMRVFGSGVSEPCTDSELVVPVGTDNRDDLDAAIEAYEPDGDTPTGFALRGAADDLGSEGKRSIVLVSDGESNCDPDPCTVAAELAEDGIDLTIDVVGLDVDSRARDELQCVARAGNGTYYDVDSTEELASSLERLATRASRTYATIGQPVRGAESASEAPEIGSGDWVDSVPADSTRVYRLTRDIGDSTLHLGASLRSGSAADDVLRVELATEDGTSCGGDGITAERASGALITASARAGDTTASACSAGDVIATVVREGGVEEAPVELRVLEEPSVVGADSLPEPQSAVTWSDPETTERGEVVGGTSFDDAPVLEPGTYQDTIVPGEALTYQVDASWGQQVVATVEYPRAEGNLAEAIGPRGMIGTVAIVDPARARAGLGSLATGAPPNQSQVGNQGQTQGNSTAPIAYRNREDTGAAGGAALDGRYTVVVGLESDPEGDDYLIPVTIRVGLVGEAEPGPEYAEEIDDPDAPPTATEDTSGSALPWVVAAVAVVALLGLAGWFVARSRRTPNS